MAEGKTVKIICVGKKGYDVLRREFRDQIVELIELRGVRQLGFENAEGIARNLLGRFDAGEFDIATLFYSRFRSVIAQIPTAQQIIPAEIARPAPPTGRLGRTRSTSTSRRGRDPGGAAAPNLTVQILRALLENAASEQGARMGAMDSATRNAGEMIKKQTLIYNRTRQAR